MNKQNHLIVIICLFVACLCKKYDVVDCDLPHEGNIYLPNFWWWHMHIIYIYTYVALAHGWLCCLQPFRKPQKSIESRDMGYMKYEYIYILDIYIYIIYIWCVGEVESSDSITSAFMQNMHDDFQTNDSNLGSPSVFLHFFPPKWWLTWWL